MTNASSLDSSVGIKKQALIRPLSHLQVLLTSAAPRQSGPTIGAIPVVIQLRTIVIGELVRFTLV